jgi:hypothetical protein
MPAKKASASIIGRATDHYKQKPLRRIEIPEWGDDEGPLVVFAEPFTLRDQAKIATVTKNQPESEVLAELLIMKLIDEDGNKIFTVEDKHALRTQVDAQVVARIATQVMGVDEGSLEKN